MTNQEHIQSMGVYELAKFLTDATVYTPYAGATATYINRLTGEETDYKAALKGTKEWLEEESK